MPAVMIEGPAGRLEARYHPGRRPEAPLAVVLHPHPLYGGTMANRVVYALFDAFAKRGCAVVRFNFRGVGLSHGGFGHGDGEQQDAEAALEWLAREHPRAAATWVAGFSFGSWIGLRLAAAHPHVSGFIAIAPPVNLYNFDFLHPCRVSGLVVQGDQDDVVPEPPVTALAQRLVAQPGIRVDYHRIPGADHFFGEHMPALNAIVDTYLDHRLYAPDD